MRKMLLLMCICLLLGSSCSRALGMQEITVGLERDYVRRQSTAGKKAAAAAGRVIGGGPMIGMGTRVVIRIDGEEQSLGWGDNTLSISQRALSDGRLRVTVDGDGNHAFLHQFQVTVPDGDGRLVLDLEQETLRRP
ncbi:MAG: hypothetical protein ACOCXJ_00585 [Planctomycetota bacterium]